MHVADLALTILWLVVFIAGAAFVLLPVLRFAVRVAAERFKASDSDLVAGHRGDVPLRGG